MFFRNLPEENLSGVTQLQIDDAGLLRPSLFIKAYFMNCEIRQTSLKDECLPQFLSTSNEFMSRFKGMAIERLRSLGSFPPVNCSNFLILAFPSLNTPPIAFHYFYTFEGSHKKSCCDLWAVFVEEKYKEKGSLGYI